MTCVMVMTLALFVLGRVSTENCFAVNNTSIEHASAVQQAKDHGLVFSMGDGNLVATGDGGLIELDTCWLDMVSAAIANNRRTTTFAECTEMSNQHIAIIADSMIYMEKEFKKMNT